MEICSEIISAKIKVMFTFKHLRKIIKEQIFTGLLIIFTLIYDSFSRSYKIVSPQNAKRGKACAFPLSADANVCFFFGSAKTSPVVPPAGKVGSG